MRSRAIRFVAVVALALACHACRTHHADVGSAMYDGPLKDNAGQLVQPPTYYGAQTNAPQSNR